VTAIGSASTIPGLFARATAGPAYSADQADLADARIAGLDLPIRATVALFVATAAVLADDTGLVRFDASPRGIAVERLVVFGLVPLAVVVLNFRDRPGRYGLQLGDWRWGAALLFAGVLVMTPVILALATRPDFASYYGVRPAPFADVLANNVLELFPAEFLLRGFLLFALLRRIGPLALVVVQVPFIFAHVGKPEIELWSTFIGGTVFAWLNWRTSSIVWSALGHAFVLTLMLVAVGGAR
jgi:membrane protease YdiL (CAAX protease family)